jgi:hypothetical protein
MINTILNRLIEIFKTIDSFKGSDGSIRVYDYECSMPEGYPAICVIAMRGDESVLDNTRNLMRHTFLARVIQEKIPESEGGFGPQKAERVSRQRAEDVINKIHSDNDLGLDNVLRTTVSYEFGKHPSEPRLLIDFTIVVETAAEITM